jgi:2-C-methyl-D-erythritol 4-phosphate cytidylyltransferase
MPQQRNTQPDLSINESVGSVYVIIVAGGSGTRMNSDVPKQFIELQGKPVLMHTIQKFAQVIPNIKIILVLAPSYNELWKKLCEQYKFNVPYQLTEGGTTRFHSVKNGLHLVPENSIVGIHDAARPLVSKQTILNAFETAVIKGNACPAIPLNESVREVHNGSNKAVDRTNYLLIQTPQCFQSNLIKKAFLQDYQVAFTDDASVLEAIGEKINLIEGNRENIKITTPQDLVIANALMSVIS